MMSGRTVKKVACGALFALVVTALLIWLGQGSGELESRNGLLVLGTHPGYAPYESIDSSGQVVGFDIDVANAIGAELDQQVVISQAPFDTLILGLKKGKFDLIMAGISITPERLNEIAMVPYHGNQVSEVSLVFWEHIPDGLRNFEGIARSHQTIAVMQGTWQELLLNQFPDAKVRPLEGNTDLIMDVKYGKSVAALFETHVAETLQLQVPELQLVTIPLPANFQILGEGIGIRPDNSTLIDQIQTAVNELQANGVIAELESKWLGGAINE